MSAASLFPGPDLPVVPSGARDEPELWVRRLLIVSERRPGAAVIRDVSFRTGLNIVRVAERPAGETRPIGHSVGKTLLARLLRETGDPATAVAAYYQGLGSVRRIGMLPETRPYVATVLALRSRFGG